MADGRLAGVKLTFPSECQISGVGVRQRASSIEHEAEDQTNMTRTLQYAAAALTAVAVIGWSAARADIKPNQLPTNGDVVFCSGHPWIDVRCYGALGDGNHDDTSAIHDAITDATNPLLVAGGAPVHFPTGTYKVTSKLTWDYHDISGYGLRIISEGAVIDG